MKRLFYALLAGTVSFSVIGCGSQNSLVNNDIVSNQVNSLSKTDSADTAFAKFAATKSTNAYKGADKVFANKGKVPQNGLFDSFSKEFPYRSYFEFEKDISNPLDKLGEDFSHIDYWYIYNDRSGFAKRHFDSSYNAYLQVHQMYKANKAETKRFIRLDVLANAINSDYFEVHNPPFQPNFKIMPTKAAQIMPTFAELCKYNDSKLQVNWDSTRAKQFYRDNYNRYMGMIMEFAPNKNDAYALIHREVSDFAWRK